MICKLCECSVSALWVLGECSECSVNALWVLCECSVSALWVLCECSVSILWVLCECSVSALWVLCLFQGWEYSAFVFLVLNVSAVSVITFCYVAMFVRYVPHDPPTDPSLYTMFHLCCDSYPWSCYKHPFLLSFFTFCFIPALCVFVVTHRHSRKETRHSLNVSSGLCYLMPCAGSRSSSSKSWHSHTTPSAVSSI